MSNSRLATYIDTSTGNYTKRKYDITRITIHHAAGVGNCNMLSNVLKSGRECSWNYGIGNDGVIGLFVEEKNRAWTSSNADNDHRAITIEVCNSTGSPSWKVSDKAYASLLNLCEDICRRNNIKQLTFTGQLSGSNLTMHQWFKSTNCPGPYLGGKFPDICNQVNRRLGAPSQIVYPTGATTAYDDSTFGYSYVDPKSIIRTEGMTPYIANVKTTASNVNYEKLAKMGVAGVMFSAGCLYDSVHSENTRYVNSKLKTEVAKAHKADLLHGLYATVRARSSAEAKKECEQLYYVISKYPPTLGLWLKLELVKSKSINHQILDIYYENCVEWGLKDKCGLYATKSQLNMIDWSKYKDKYYLWLDSHLDSVASLDELLTPEMFDVT